MAKMRRMSRFTLMDIYHIEASPGGGGLAVVAKLIVPAEFTADMAQMLAADYAESGVAFERMPTNAVAIEDGT
jgi:hypothetical protein